MPEAFELRIPAPVHAYPCFTTKCSNCTCTCGCVCLQLEAGWKGMYSAAAVTPSSLIQTPFSKCPGERQVLGKGGCSSFQRATLWPAVGRHEYRTSTMPASYAHVPGHRCVGPL
eukprot:scaffold142983_cov22-Tisochrysis_lutea.AAC.2